MKYVLILLFLFSCSKTEEPKVVTLDPPKPVLPMDQGVIKDQEIIVKDQELPVKDQEVKRASFPGYECEKFFPQDAIKKLMQVVRFMSQSMNILFFKKMSIMYLK